MLAELSLKLRSEHELGFWHSSLLQGVLMEHASKAFAEKMHETGLHPYSQCVLVDHSKNVIWKIRTVDDEAYKGILEPWLSPTLKTFKIEKLDASVEIVERVLVTRDNGDLLERFYSGETDRSVRIRFDSPTAFKSNERYVFMPELHLIFGSLMRKYSTALSDMDMTDQETLDYIIEHTHISAYKLRSTLFPLEGAKIPSFMGEITLRFTGTDTMARYARLLLEYGEYSGVGIKTGIGMGAIKIIQGGKDERKND